MNITYHEELSSPATITGPVHSKEFIAIHWYGDPNTAGDVHATARYLSGVAHASVNYVAGDGHVYCLVNPTQVAYGQGDGANGYGNLNGISIENDPRMKDIDLETTAHLIAKIRMDFGYDFPLRPHNDFVGTQCPGVWESRLAWLDQRAREIQAGGVSIPVPIHAAPISDEPYVPNDHWVVDPGDTLTKVAEHYGVSVDALVKFNAGITNPDRISVGSRIWSPNAGTDTWKVDPGDTLSGISAWYATQGHTVTVQELQYANGINDPATEVKVGMRLLVP